MVNKAKKIIDHAKQSAIDAFETSLKRALKKTVEATSDVIGNKIENKISKISKTSQQNNSDTVPNEHGKSINK